MLCKGTGTKVGDPIECRAIYETLGKRASPNRKLILGSVKPNVRRSARFLHVSKS